MKRMISLIKVLYKTNKNNFGKLKNNSKIFLYILCGAYILFVFSNFWSLFISPLKEAGKPELAVGVMINIVSIFIFLTSITYIANILYFSNDIENILPLPFKPKEIFVAKLFTVYLYELMIAIMFLFPGFICYGYLLNEGIFYYLKSVVILLLIPIIPILLLTTIYIFIMQFFKLTKYKNFFKIFTTILLLTIVIAFQMNMNSNMTVNGEYSTEYIVNFGKTINAYTPYFLKIAKNTLIVNDTFSSVLSIIWYLIINAILILLVVLLESKLYMKEVYNLLGYNLKRRNNRKKLQNKIRPFLITLVNKDIKKLFRNATFFIQCVIPIFLMPVIIMIISVQSIKEIANDVFIDIPTIKIIFEIVFMQFFMMMNYVSITAVSRDGKDEIMYMKTLPIEEEKQLYFKTIPGILFGMMSLIISIIIIHNIFIIDFKEFVLLTVIGVLLNVMQSYLYLMIDIRHPKLYWESEMAVVKQNINIFYGIFIWMGVIFLTIMLGNAFININVLYFEVLYVVLLLTICFILKSCIKNSSIKL